MIDQGTKFYIGIDVSKDTLDVFISPISKHMQFKNDVKGIKQLTKKFDLFTPVTIVMEATGGYERPVAQALAKANFTVAVLNPRQIRDFAKALGKLAKTDKIDAHIIALFAEKMQPKANVVCNENQQNLADNNARRRQLIEMIGMEKNRLEKATDFQRKSIKRVLKILEKELISVDEAQKEAIKNDEQCAQKNELLQSIKGVGTIVAAGIISDLPELGRLTAKEIAALVGLAPYNRDSGTLRGKRAIWGGRSSVRCILYMATIVAMRHNYQIKAFYQRLCNAGKVKKVAITACMRKLLIIMNAMVKNNKTWRMATVDY